MQNNFDGENQVLKQTLRDMKADIEKLETELVTLRPTTPTITLPTTQSTEPSVQNPCQFSGKRFNGHCYWVVGGYDQKKSWGDAAQYCEFYNSYLVEITSDVELEFIYNEIVTRYSHYWIGATDMVTKGKFVYEHSNQEVPIKYWRRGQPDNRDGDKRCVALHGLLLYDRSCFYTRPFVCEKS